MILEKLEIQFTADVSGALKNINALKKAATGTKSADKVKVDADTTKAEKKLKAVAKQAKDIPDGDVEVSADTTEAESKLKAVSKQAESLPDADINVTADTSEAESSLKAVSKQAQNLPDAEIKVTADTTEADKKIKDIDPDIPSTKRNVASPTTKGQPTSKKEPSTDGSKPVNGKKGSGSNDGVLKTGAVVAGSVLAAGKVGFDLAETAYGAVSAQNRLEILLPEEAVTRVERYAEGMNEIYGLNETATKSRMTNFAAVFRGIGMDTDDAVNYAERMSNAALDYASALDKTPQEVTDIMMSLMRGNLSVADNIGIFGLTADKLDDKVKELEEEGLMPENIDDASKKFIALTHIIEENAATQGFTGDFARTADEFGNQVSVLGEQWQTLKEKAGALLLPAAEIIVSGMSGIVGAITSFVSPDNKTFIEQMEGYFGGTDLSDEEIAAIVEDAVGPMKTIAAEMRTAREDLDASFAEYETAYTDFWKKLNILYITGEPVTAAVEEEIATMQDNWETALIDGENSVLKMQESALFSYFNGINAMTGYMFNEATKAGTEAVRSYFSEMESEAMQLSNEYTALMRQVFEDQVITPEEWTLLEEQNRKMNEFNTERITIENRARMQRIADEGVGVSYNSAKELTDRLLEESNATQEELDIAFGAVKDWYYTDAAYQQEQYEKDPAAYIKEHGAAPLSAKERMEQDGVYAMYDTAVVNSRSDVARVVGETFIRPLLSGLDEEMATFDGNTNNREFFDRYMMPLFAQYEYFDYLDDIVAAGGTLSPENLEFYNRFEAAAALLPTIEYNGQSVKLTPEMLITNPNLLEWLMLPGLSGEMYGVGENDFVSINGKGLKTGVVSKYQQNYDTLSSGGFIETESALISGIESLTDLFDNNQELNLSQYPTEPAYPEGTFTLAPAETELFESFSSLESASENQQEAASMFLDAANTFSSAVNRGFTVYVDQPGTYTSGVKAGRASNMADRVMMVK